MLKIRRFHIFRSVCAAIINMNKLDTHTHRVIDNSTAVDLLSGKTPLMRKQYLSIPV